MKAHVKPNYKKGAIMGPRAMVTPRNMVPLSVNYESLDSMDQFGLATEL